MIIIIFHLKLLLIRLWQIRGKVHWIFVDNDELFVGGMFQRIVLLPESCVVLLLVSVATCVAASRTMTNM